MVEVRKKKVIKKVVVKKKVKKPVSKPAEQPAEQPVEQLTEQPTEQPVEQPTEQPVEQNQNNNTPSVQTDTVSEEEKTKISNQINQQLNDQEIWDKNIDKFYNHRDGDNFTRSNCSGKKRAVFIGINYLNSKYVLKGCISDANNMKNILSTKYGFQDYIILTDDTEDATKQPTKDNIINAMKWIVQDAKPGDSLFFHFSGHGGKVKDNNGDEIDGFDETIMPIDYKKNGQIKDDTINELMVKPLPKGCKLTAVFDCCHSGTMMDLPYTYQFQDSIEVIENDVRREVFNKTDNVVKSIMSGDAKAISNSLLSIFDGSLKKSTCHGMLPETIRERQSLGEIIQFSACRDNQTSVDLKVGKTTTGALTCALSNQLKDDNNYTYTELLTNVRKYMIGKKFRQVPQISTSRPLNMNDQFIL
jgi:hypothetical protein